MTKTFHTLDIRIEPDSLSATGQKLDIRVSDDACADLAKRIGVDGIQSLNAKADLRPAMGRQFILEGSVSAHLTQACVVSGEPVSTELRFPLRRSFAEDADPFEGLSEEDEDTSTNTGDDDDIEPLQNGLIDLGTAVYEELVLQIPPYPRKPGAEFVGYATETEEEEASDNPFAVLKALKNQ